MSVVISGGGMIGLILALKLSKLTQGRLEISLIEQNSIDICKDKFFLGNPGVIALSRGAYFELSKIDIISSILSHYSSIVDTLEISEYSKFSEVFIDAQDYHVSELGYIMPLFPIRRELYDVLYRQPGVTIYCSVKIQHIIRKKSHNIIFLNTGKKIISKLIIAADGSGSNLINYYGIQQFKWNYHQTAVVTEVTTAVSHCGRAFERFTPFGPLVFLPMSNRNVSFMIWCIFKKRNQEIFKYGSSNFSKILQKMFGWKLGKILHIKNRYFHNLWLIYSYNHIAYRLALVGNSAQKLHPIAGQGFNLGIRDVVVLSEIIYQALRDNVDIGDYSVLSAYQKRRRLDQFKTIAATDGLINLFENHYLPLIIARNLGLFCIEHNSFLKDFFVKKALFWSLM
ncbi:2-octaprenyl-6-methoxyphenol hydroxylase [Candidatus Blochmanniella vafra str. BVAF]|uniref:2-octaprenyl-6-methoxyphenol hydroxylase n=1 Tax=Blochmanniella vafra (strain BVAF) TaxID=859654 RepID=E8Q643_BLOVB|nr:FAD-dependent monooxygenase [Candidatus Blochmannia vafer]ADV33659.1 2-octaprenyl-6-methoxyphenol hydroxylase [Candidatus Blochmannia vafer str. BVAF]